MAATATNLRPSNHVKAFLDLVYDIKFSKHVPLVMILLFALFAIWRTNNYIYHTINPGWFISFMLALCIEIAMLAAGASCVVSMREAYMRELQGTDAKRSQIGVYASYTVLILVTIALLVLAGADGALESNGDISFILLMVLIQFAQSATVITFISIADLELREKLRKEVNTAKMLEAALLQEKELEDRQRKANSCPYCARELQPKNRKRHINSCPAKV